MPAIVVFSNQKCWNSPARENDTGKMSNFSLFIFRVVAILNVAIIASACQKSAESDLPKSPGNKADAPFYIRLNSSTRKFSMNDSSAHKTYYSSKSDDTFREYSSYTGRSGVTHKRFQQYYKNFNDVFEKSRNCKKLCRFMACLSPYYISQP